MDDSAIIQDEVRESYDEEINFNEKKQSVKQRISVNIYFYSRKTKNIKESIYSFFTTQIINQTSFMLIV